MSSAREVLLDKVMVQVAESGLGDVSLRELAEAVGTSHRMLLYHFGSREGLTAAIVTAMEDRQRAALAAIVADAASPAEVVLRQWDQLSAPAIRPFVALFFEVFAQAAFRRPGTEAFLPNLTEPWLDLATELATRLDVRVNRAELRLGVAVMRGLLLEVLASGDPEPATESLHRFLRMWEMSAGTKGSDPTP